MTGTLLKFRRIIALLCINTAVSITAIAQHSNVTTEQYATNVIVSGLVQPWAHEFLPNGDILVTERGGTIKVVRDGIILNTAVANVPDVYFAGQGGLLDIMKDIDFANNQLIYLSYAYRGEGGNATRLVSARLISNADGYELSNVNHLFTASPLIQTPQHYSGRIAQMTDGTLLLTIGDGFDYREQAQKLDSHLGKIIRVNRDGSAPADNPFIGRDDALPEICSYGHRNHQSLVIANGVVYQNEHGPKGGDEVNIIRPGANYGWPVITYGRDYNGANITPYTEYPSMEQPLVDWTPSTAPSSMVYYQNKLYVAALAEKSIRELSIENGKISDNGKVFEAIDDRIRDIAVGPDRKLYVLTDGDKAQLIQISLNK